MLGSGISAGCLQHNLSAKAQAVVGADFRTQVLLWRHAKAGLLMPSLPYKRSAKHSIVGLGRRDRLSLLLNSSPLVLFPLTIALLAMVLAVPMVWLLNLYGVGAAYGVLGVWLIWLTCLPKGE